MNPLQDCLSHAALALRPVPLRMVAGWSDENRVLSSTASGEPGPWRTERTPYLRDIMNSLSPNNPVEKVVFMKGAQIGGPLALDTPIPTACGWKTMGGLQVGDALFDERGQPCRITSVSEVWMGRPCYEVIFEDGEKVICDGVHLWTVWDFTADKPVERTLCTEDMIGRLMIGSGPRHRYAVDCCAPVELPEQDLIIHPYVLGVWLGNGSSFMNHITVHEDDAEIADHIRACGYEAEFRLPHWRKGKAANIVIDPTFRTVSDDGAPATIQDRSRFTQRLMLLDLIDNKHIPAPYMRASREQRLELVRGLMDSDGSMDIRGKRCEFSNADRKLIDALVELLRSLGYKPTVYNAPSRRRVFPDGNRPCQTLVYWRVSWTAYREEPMFRLARKRARMRSVEQGRPFKSRRRRIVAIDPVPSVPVRCIEVNSPSHLYLCGRGWIPTHNTEAGNNWIGYVIHHAPGPMLAVQPTVEMAKRWSKQRIATLIESTPVLRALVKEARARDSGNTIQSKEFPGGILVMTGANSAVGLRSMPVRYLFLDEVDAYDFDVEGEGDPVALAVQRTITFANRKIFLVSTPTIQGVSRIEIEYEQSDKRRWWVPCPECGGHQVLEEKRLLWEKGRPETALYYCVHCGAGIPSHKKAWMNAQGEWRPENPDNPVAGFHLSGLYSPWLTWQQIAERKAAAKDDASMKVYVNTIEARTWTEIGEAPEWQRLYDRREDYRPCVVPAGGLFLTAGVDVQDNRLEVEIVAWGRERESWSIDYRVFHGLPSNSEAWEQLDDLLDERFTHESGIQLGILRMAIDTGGHFTPYVYDWVRKKRNPRVLAIKGSDVGGPIGVSQEKDVTTSGKRKRRGFSVWQVGTWFCKSELYGYLRKDRPTDEQLAAGEKFPAGYCHFPKYGEEYFKQLTAERLVTKKDTRGFAKREWQQMRERNEALDCRVYARAAAAAYGIDRFNDYEWQKLERALGRVLAAPTAEASQQQALASTQIERRVIRSGYL